MADVVTTLNELSTGWAAGMWAAVWQSAILGVLVLALTKTLKRSSASLRFWLWMLVPLRLLMMPLITVTLPILPVAPPVESAAATVVSSATTSDSAPYLEESDEEAGPVTSAAAVEAASVSGNTAPLASSPRLLACVMGLWFVGAGMWGVRMVRCHWKVHRILRDSCAVTDTATIACIRQAAAMLGLRSLPKVVIAREVGSPFTCGLGRPTVVLPAAFVEKVDRGTLLAVLAHEFAHIRRHDLALGVVLAVCDALYFFHPVVHLARRRLLLERERACDDFVLVTSHARPSAYARALVTAAGVCPVSGRPTAPLAVVTESFANLRTRLTAIASNLTPRAGLSPIALLSIILLVLVCVPGVALTARETARSLDVAKNEASAVGASQMDRKMVATRVLHFPADRSMGEIMVKDKSAPRSHEPFQWFNSDDFYWDYLGEARGDVAIPVDKKVRLVLSPVGAEDLASLRELEPDDLHSLSMGSNPPADAAMAHIAHLTGLKRLNLLRSEITAAGLESIDTMVSLENLTLPGGVGADALPTLWRLPALKVLCLSEVDVDATTCSLLAQLLPLEELTLWQCSIAPDGLAKLGELPRLRELFLASCDVADETLAGLEAMSSLQRLDLRMCTITDAGMPHVAKLERLESLNLNNTDVTAAGLAHLKALRGLKYLQISDVEDGDTALAELEAHTALEYLHLPNRGVTDAGMAHLPAFPGLTYLWVGCSSASEISDAGLAYVAELPRLETLHIGGEAVGDAGLAHLAKLSGLKSLMIMTGSMVTNEGMKSLATMTSLTELSFHPSSERVVTVSGVNHLNALANLKVLNLYYVRRDDAILDLSGLQQLEKIIVTINDGPGRDAEMAGRDADLAWVAQVSGLRWIQGIYGPEFSDAGMAHLAGLTRLERLSLGGGNVTDAGLAYLADKTELSSVTLEGDITDAGLRYFEGLPRLSLLRIDTEHTFSEAAVERLQAAVPSLRNFNPPLMGAGRRSGGSSRRGRQGS